MGDIDDVVQETYARLLRAREVGTATLTRAYLFVVARNVDAWVAVAHGVAPSRCARSFSHARFTRILSADTPAPVISAISS